MVDTPETPPATPLKGEEANPTDSSERMPAKNDESAGQTDSLLANDPFGTASSKLLFDAMDELRGCGVGQDIDLPQLVIVGKQSSGKSSLLKSLTDVPFPVGSKLCTRFATRIVSKRTPPGTHDMVHVSIEDGDIDAFGPSQDNTRIGTFNPSITSMTAEVFEDVLKQASKAMGISSSQAFSSKVLKIELSGPDRSHFGILDLPGIFDATRGEITKNDMKGVSDLTEAYMKKPQNIIICVADANDDLATQRIFTMAATHVQNHRTVGVFTKCDRTDHASDIVDIVNNKEAVAGQSLHHGWFVVQNTAHGQGVSFDRESAEKETFSKAPWTRISEKRRGSAMLKRFLASLLSQRIRESFPDMQSIVENMLERERSMLRDLGPPRPNYNLQLQYLLEIVQRFQTLTSQALKSPGLLPTDEMKLRGKIKGATDKFAENMKQEGHSYAFADIESQSIGVERTGTLGRNSAIGSVKSLYDEIRDQIRANQSEELEGMPNPAVLRPLLKKQASKWRMIATECLHEIASLTEDAIANILQAVCKDMATAPYTRHELESIVLEFNTKALKDAEIKLERTWHEDMDLHLQTKNETFAEKVKHAHLLRFQAGLQKYVLEYPPEHFMNSMFKEPDVAKNAGMKSHEPFAIISLQTVEDFFNNIHLRGAENTENEIHDLLKAYYEVAREEFISNVVIHISEPYLHDPQGPVFGLSSEYIFALPEDRIEDLGGEDNSVLKEREEITAKIARLEAAKKIAKETLRKTKAIEAL